MALLWRAAEAVGSKMKGCRWSGGHSVLQMASIAAAKSDFWSYCCDKKERERGIMQCISGCLKKVR